MSEAPVPAGGPPRGGFPGGGFPRGGFDVHAHIVPWRLIAAAAGGRFGMAVAGDRLVLPGFRVPLEPISSPGRLIERIAADGLEGAVVSIPPPLFRPELAPAERADYAAFVNDALCEACRTEAAKLRPLAYLPAEDPALAAEIAGHLGGDWAGAVVGTELGESLSYASPRFDPLWQVLEASALPLFIHPGKTPDRRLDLFYLGNLLGNPVETTLAAAHIVFGAVLHRFPRLTLILAHGGGAIAALGGRWQRGFETARPGIPALALPPLEALQRFYVDTLFHSAPFRDAALAILGAGRVLLGSDWPFPMGAPDAGHDLAGLAPELRHRIRNENCEAAFASRLRP